MKLFAQLFFICYVFSAGSQNFDWSALTTYSDNAGGREVCHDHLRKAYVTGVYQPVPNSQGNYGSFLSLYDVNGNLLWQKILPNVNRPKITYCSNNTVLLKGADSVGHYVWRFDTAGNQLDKILVLPYINGYGINEIEGIGSDANNNYYLCGQFSRNISFGNVSLQTDSGVYRQFIAKFDSQNNCVWAVRTPTGNAIRPMIMRVDPSGNTYLGAEFFNTISFGSQTITSTGFSNAFVAKFDNLGNPLWLINIGGSGQEVLSSLSVDPWGNVYALEYGFGTLIVGNNTLPDTGNNNMALMKLNNNGQCVWVKRIGGNGPYNWPGGVFATAFEVFITGHYFSGCSFDSISLTGKMEAFVAKYDYNGNAVWAIKAGCTTNSNADAVELTVNSANDIFITGGILGQASFNGHPITTARWSMYTAKLTSPNFVGLAEEQKHSDIRLYPNPAINKITLETTETITGIAVLNAAGAVMNSLVREKPESNSYILYLSDLPAGMYFVRIETASQTKVEKFVIE